MTTRVLHKAQAGTIQSSDLMVSVEPADGLEIEVFSTVERQFGHLIREQVESTLRRLEVTAARVLVDDRGALDYAIAARVEAAVRRATGT